MNKSSNPTLGTSMSGALNLYLFGPGLQADLKQTSIPDPDSVNINVQFLEMG